MNKTDTFNEHRALLFAIAYRMVGSVMDAEDLVQEAYLRWDATDTEAIESPGAFLRTVITRLAIDHLRRAKKAREVYEGLWLPEPCFDAPPANAAELSESLSTAFLVVLENLAPTERAAYLLKEVFDYSYAEIATILGKTEANCRQIAKRARDRVLENKPRYEADAAEVTRLVEEFIAATLENDMDRFSTILAEDAVLYTDHGGKIIANKRAILGGVKIAKFIMGLAIRFMPANYRMEIRTVNGAPGLVAFDGNHPESVTSFAVRDGRIQTIYTMRNPDKLTGLKPSA